MLTSNLKLPAFTMPKPARTAGTSKWDLRWDAGSRCVARAALQNVSLEGLSTLGHLERLQLSRKSWSEAPLIPWQVRSQAVWLPYDAQ